MAQSIPSVTIPPPRAFVGHGGAIVMRGLPEDGHLPIFFNHEEFHILLFKQNCLLI